MSEAEVVAELVEFTNILLAGCSALFGIVSVYIAALNYFIGSASLFARFMAFTFVCVVLGMLCFVMYGGQVTHAGLIARLREIDAAGELTAAGKAVLANSTPTLMEGQAFSLDDVVRATVWTGVSLIYLALVYLTFIHRWRPDVVPISIE
jgi:hypothetical protein